MSKNDLTSLACPPFPPRVYISGAQTFSYEARLPPMLKMHLCLYPYNLDSFNIIHERETLLPYFLLFTLYFFILSYNTNVVKIEKK